VISSSHAVAKGVLTGPDQLHLCYCHSPIRYAWDLQHQYLKESGLDHGLTGWAAKIILHYIRMWDSRTANGVNAFAANSSYIARRIRKVYNRESTILFGPVDVANYTLCTKKKDYYVTVSRMVPYKKVDLIVEAFSSMPEKRLIVIGDGPDMPKVLAKAGPNVEVVGFASAESMREYLQYARAFVFAAEEDFGLAPIEAQACGTPVIAFGKGGVLDSVRSLGAVENRPTGLFFGEQSVTAIVEAVRRFERVGDVIKPEDCRDNAMLFSQERFRTVFKTFVEEQWQAFQQNKQGGL
jgi:glycosyltransferase involved in cell wall biosynthesis